MSEFTPRFAVGEKRRELRSPRWRFLAVLGCQVSTARNREECAALLDQGLRPHLALVDYHLDEGEIGTELMAWLRTRLGEPVPGVVISADGHGETMAKPRPARNNM